MNTNSLDIFNLAENLSEDNMKINIRDEHSILDNNRINHFKDDEPHVNLNGLENNNHRPVEIQNNIELRPGMTKGNYVYINLEELSKNNKALENSEVLLALFEITSNSKYYGLDLGNKSRSFWDKLSFLKCFEKILLSFKTETLRKYWRSFSDISNVKKIIEVIKTHTKQINETSLKLLTIINAIADFVTGKITDLNKVLTDVHVKQTGEKTSRPKYVENDDDDESFKISKPKNMLNNKRKNDVETKLSISIDKANNLNASTENVEVSNKRSSRSREKNTAIFTDADKTAFSQIESVVNSLLKFYPELTNFEIWESLKKNSFNVVNTYLYLNEPEVYDGKS